MMMLRLLLLLLASWSVITASFIDLETYLANRVNDSILCLYTFDGTPLVSAIPGCPFGPLIANESNTNTVFSLNGVQLLNTSTPLEPHLVSSDVAVAPAFYTSVIDRGLTFEIVFRAYQSHLIASSNVNLFTIAGAYDDYCMHRGFRVELSDRRLLVLIFYTIEPDGSCLEQHFYSMMETKTQPCLVPVGTQARPPPMTHAFVSIRPQARENNWLVFFLLSYINDDGHVQTCVAYNSMGGRGPRPHDADTTMTTAAAVNIDKKKNDDDKKEIHDDDHSDTRRGAGRHRHLGGGLRLYLGNNARVRGHRRQIPAARTNYLSRETPENNAKHDYDSNNSQTTNILTLLDEVQERLDSVVPRGNGFFVALNGKKIVDVDTYGVSFRNGTKLGQAQDKQKIRDAFASVAASHAVRARQEEVLRALDWQKDHIHDANGTLAMMTSLKEYPQPNASSSVDVYWFVIANATWNVLELRARNEISLPFSLGVRNRSVYINHDRAHDDDDSSNNNNNNNKYIEIHLRDIIHPNVATRSSRNRNHDSNHTTSRQKEELTTTVVVQIHYLYTKNLFLSSPSFSSSSSSSSSSSFSSSPKNEDESNAQNITRGMWTHCHRRDLNHKDVSTVLETFSSSSSSSSSTLTLGSIIFDQCARFQLQPLSSTHKDHAYISPRQPVAIIGYAAANVPNATTRALSYVHVFLNDKPPPRLRHDKLRIHDDYDDDGESAVTILLVPPYGWTHRVKKHARAMFTIPLWIVPSRRRRRFRFENHHRASRHVDDEDDDLDDDTNLAKLIFRVTLEGPGTGGRLNTTSDFLSFRSFDTMKTHYCGFDAAAIGSSVCLAKDNHSTGVWFELLGPVQNPTRLVFRGTFAQIQRALTNISWVNWRHRAHNASLVVRVEHLWSLNASSSSSLSTNDDPSSSSSSSFIRPRRAIDSAQRQFTMHFLPPTATGAKDEDEDMDENSCTPAALTFGLLCGESFGTGSYSLWISLVFLFLVHIWTQRKRRQARSKWANANTRVQNEDEFNGMLDQLVYIIQEPNMEAATALWCACLGRPDEERLCAETLLCLLYPTFPRFLASLMLHHPRSCRRHRRRLTRFITVHNDDDDDHDDDDPHAVLIRLYFKCIGRAWFADLIQALIATTSTAMDGSNHHHPHLSLHEAERSSSSFVLNHFFETVSRRLSLLPAPLTIVLQVAATSGYRSRSRISILWTHFLAPACAAVFDRDICLALEDQIVHHGALSSFSSPLDPLHHSKKKTRYVAIVACGHEGNYFKMDSDDDNDDDGRHEEELEDDDERRRRHSLFNIGFDPRTEYLHNADLVQNLMPTVLRHLYCLLVHHRQVIATTLEPHDPTMVNNERSFLCVRTRLEQVLEALEGTRHVMLNEILALCVDPVHALQY